MLIFKFTKTRSAALVSHVDNLRAVTYILRRAQLDAEYSQGFNPHIELGFSPPIALGVESLAEYVSVRTAEQSDMLSRLNAVSPDGIEFVRQFNAEVNLAASLKRAQYRLQASGLGDVVEEILAPNYAIAYEEQGERVVKEVSSRIFAACRVDSDTALVTLAIGNDNLRPDRLTLHLMNVRNLSGDYSITKVVAFADDVLADDFLQARSKLPSAK